ncbi:MAG: hypothetical protein R2806_16005 [Saprospiraceae bacterium]
MSATGYQVKWLQDRYLYDAEARETHRLEDWLEAHPQSVYRIYDLGAGLASNFRFWNSRIPSEQEWSLIEIDPVLIEAGKAYLPENNAQIRVQYAQGDFVAFLAHHTPPDLLLCNALLDVLTAEQMVFLLDYLWKHQVPLLASINYHGMEFNPSLPEDHPYVLAYEAHMERIQPSGRALGRSLDAFLTTIQGPYQVIRDPSPWHIPADDPEMLFQILQFMAAAVPEVLPADKHSAFEQWLQYRKSQVEAGQLNIRVHHYDAWITKNKKNLG